MKLTTTISRQLIAGLIGLFQIFTFSAISAGNINPNPPENTTGAVGQVVLPNESKGVEQAKDIIEVIIGTGEETSGSLPISPWWGYSFSQTIYLQSEINLENKRISRIGFQYADGTPEISEITEIWLGHTALTQLDQTVQLGQSTKVYDGPFDFSIMEDFSWVDIEHYFYNNADNLLITVIEKKPGWNSSADVFYVTPNEAGQPVMARYARNDNNPYDPTSLPDGFAAEERANIKLWLEDIPDHPEININPDSLNFGEIELTMSDTLHVTVQNVGGAALEITGAHFSNDNFSLADGAFPLLLQTGEQHLFAVVFHPSAAQVENGVLTFLVDESVPGNKTVELSGRGLRFGVLREGFEDELFPPLGWLVVDNNNDGETWFRNVNNVPTGQTAPRTGEAAAGLPPYAGNWGQTAYDDWLITPKMVWEDGDLFEFWIKRVANQTDQIWRVQLSTTGTNITDFFPIDEIVDPPLTYTQKSYDLSQHGLNNGSQYYIAFQFNGVWCWPGVIDDVLGSVVVSYENDLMMLDFSGENIVYQNATNNYEVFFGNYGTSNVQGSNYEIKIFAVFNGQQYEIASAAGMDIAAGETKTISIPITLDELGDYQLYAKIEWEDDDNPLNNTSDMIAVEVISNSIVIKNIGTFPPNQQTPYYYLYPISFDDYRGESLHECLYYSSELNTGGIITRLTYYTSFAESIPNRKVKVWMTSTDMENFAESAIPASEMNLVFDGLLNFYAGIGKVDIQLSEPFVYTSANNLAVLVYYYQGGNPYINNTSKFAYEYIESGPIRNVYDNWYTAIDPNNLQNVARAPSYPITSLMFETGNGLGQLSGKVYYQDNMQPAEGAKVEIENADFPEGTAIIFTDASGNYLAPYAMAGDNLTVTISKYGYADVVYEDVALAPGGTLVLSDAYLVARPLVSLSGSVIKSDTQTAATGAEVKLYGLDDYATTTGDLGEFHFAEVWGMTEYQLEISLEGYQTYVAEIALGDIPLTLDPVTIAEIAPAPHLLTAEEAGDYVILNWYGAGSPFPWQFRYDDGVAVGVLITTGTPNIIGGSAWKHNAIVNQVQWYTYQSGSYPPSPTVRLTILGLNPDGSPNPGDVLFVQEQVANNFGWNTFELPHSVYAPNGFFFGASGYSNYTLIAYDDGVGEPWEWQPMTQWSNGMGSYLPLENVTAPPLFGNIFIRASGKIYEEDNQKFLPDGDGYILQTDGSESLFINKRIDPVYTGDPEMSAPTGRALEHYNIYRKMVDEDDWTHINQSPLSDTTYMDLDWLNLEAGYYHYAVEAEYTNGVLSGKAISNELHKLPTGITERKTEIVQLFPNPTNGIVNIISAAAINGIEVADHFGRVVLRIKAAPDDQTLDLSILKNGVYFIHVDTQSGSFTKKVVLTG